MFPLAELFVVFWQQFANDCCFVPIILCPRGENIRLCRVCGWLRTSFVWFLPGEVVWYVYVRSMYMWLCGEHVYDCVGVCIIFMECSLPDMNGTHVCDVVYMTVL